MRKTYVFAIVSNDRTTSGIIRKFIEERRQVVVVVSSVGQLLRLFGTSEEPHFIYMDDDHYQDHKKDSWYDRIRRKKPVIPIYAFSRSAVRINPYAEIAKTETLLKTFVIDNLNKLNVLAAAGILFMAEAHNMHH